MRRERLGRTATTGRRRRGFTLVELLVVIVILGVLIGLLVPAVMSAVRRGREAQAEGQLNTLAEALASFNTKYGKYPPSRLVFHESGYLGTAGGGYFAGMANDSSPIGGRPGVGPAAGSPEHRALVARSVTALRSLFPKLNISAEAQPNPTATLAPTLPNAPGWYDINGNGEFDAAPILLDGHECLALFLGGVGDWDGDAASGWTLRGMGGFNNHPRNPFTRVPPEGPGAGTRLDPFYEVARPDRLSDDDRDGIPGLLDPLGVASEGRYIAFFAAGHGGYDPRDVQLASEPAADFALPGVGVVAANGPNPWCDGPSDDPTRAPRWLRPQSYQLLSPGPDRRYGPGGEVEVNGTDWEYPGGPGRGVERDNVALR